MGFWVARYPPAFVGYHHALKIADLWSDLSSTSQQVRRYSTGTAGDFEPQDVLSAGSGSAFASYRNTATLKVHGLPRQGELYLVSGLGEQRTVGRGLSDSNVLVSEGLTPGDYTLVRSLDGKEQSWPITLAPGSQAFDLRTGAFR